MNLVRRAMKLMSRRLRKRASAKSAHREAEPYYKAAGPLAREVLRNQIRARGGRGFGGGKAMRLARRKLLEKMRPGDCTAPLVAARFRGEYPLTDRLARDETKELVAYSKALGRISRSAGIAAVAMRKLGEDSHA